MTEMELAEYARVAANEERHWWYRATRSLTADLLGPWLRPGIEVLDAGCGPGGNSAWLSGYGQVTGLDPSAEALRLARERHPELEAVQGDIAALPFERDSFDVAMALTVLAMVEDDGRAVAELARVVRPQGAVLLFEPALPRLRRDHDVVTRVLRRYRLAELERLAVDAGLEVRRTTYAYSFLVAPALLLGAWHAVRPERAGRHSDLERDRLGGLFGRLAALERRVLARRRVPLGLSAIVVATAQDSAPPAQGV